LENIDKIDISYLVLAGSLGMVILAVSVILFVVVYQKKVLAQQFAMQNSENRHQKELTEASIEVAETERERIAKNIHDDLGTQLNVLKLILTKIARNTSNTELVQELIRESGSLLELSIENIRGISQDLMPPTLVKLGYEKGLSELSRQINASGIIKMDLLQTSSGIRLSPKTELQLYRIVQEVINNIIKHAAAKSIAILLSTKGPYFITKILHDGNGIDADTASRLAEGKKGIGLKSIQSRAQVIQATVDYLAPAGQSPSIHIQVPL
jgi:two-component system NarL family sensor kinase